MVARKLSGRPKKEKPKVLGPTGRKVRKSLRIEEMADAIVDGKILCEEGERLVLRKDYLEDITTSYVTVMSIDHVAGTVTAWDETQQQWAPVLTVAESGSFTLKREAA